MQLLLFYIFCCIRYLQVCICMSTCIHAHVIIFLGHAQYWTHVVLSSCSVHVFFIISPELSVDRMGTNANLPVKVVRMIASQ